MSAARLTVGGDGVALITLDVEGRPMNVLTPEFRADLRSAIDRVAEDDAIRGAVITSAKKAFMAGADLKDIAARWGRISHQEALERSQATSSLYRRLETCGKPIAAAINGVALGGGFELCLACHYRVLADDPRVVVGLPEVTVGLLPGGGGTQRLPRLVNLETALDVLFDGKPIKPATALRIGLVSELAPASALVNRARAWIVANPQARQPWDAGRAGAVSAAAVDERLSRISTEARAHYPAYRAIASAVREGAALPFVEALAVESRYFAELLSGPVAQNIVRTMFVNKGDAERLARRPSGVPKMLGVSIRSYTVDGLTPLAEILLSAKFDAGALAHALDVVAQLRMTPIVTRGTKGLVEAMRAAAEDELSRGSEDLEQRKLTRMALEAVRAFDQQEIDSAAVADLASVFGAGYPPYTGGALSFIDTQGLASFVEECESLTMRHGDRFAPPSSLRERARTNEPFHRRA
jgi:3-hydroxyacyl-CoA dehydrogenase/enoyl-CoA hydratase/3-hydroxybutyryl-CoA epimerase